MNYQIIKDEDKFREFIEWLPDLDVGERYYVALFARKKYCREVKYIKTDKAQVSRFLSNKEDLFNKVRRLEAPLDSYVIKDITIPQEALALYISVNPRDLEEATRALLVKCAQMLRLKYNGYNPVAEAMSEAHRAVSRKIWYDFDFDVDDCERVIAEVKSTLFSICPSAVKFIKTKNGLHVCIHIPTLANSDIRTTWYKAMAKIEGCDVKGDNLLPVVGCTQGEFVPYFL